MKTGIYEILNTETGTWYRGATGKQTFERRWGKHKHDLNAGEHGNSHLQEDWDHYGADAFKFSVLSRCAPEFCDELEKYWIGEDYQRRDISYNKRGGGPDGALSEEMKQNISEGQKIAWARPETIRNQRESQGQPFTCTHPDGRVKRYLSTREAAPELGVSSGTIHNYLKGITTPGKYKSSAHLKECVFAYVK